MIIVYKAVRKNALQLRKDWAVSICLLENVGPSFLLLAEVYAVFLRFAHCGLSQHSGVSCAHSKSTFFSTVCQFVKTFYCGCVK